MKLALKTLSILVCSCAFFSCKSKGSADAEAPPPVVIHPELNENQLQDAPTTFLRSAAKSKIHWQNWNPSVLEKAADANRMIFAIIGSARYPGCFETLEALDNDPALIRSLNENFVPVLADIDMSRETGLIAYALSPETGSPIAFPFIILLSPEGSPVTWQPLQYRDDRSIRDFFDNSVEVVTRLWDDPKYINEDSADKLARRQENLALPDPSVEDPEERKSQFQAALRRINSFYDADIGSVSGAGGLFPFGVFDSLILAQYNPILPAQLRANSKNILDAYTQTILGSAMVDPLDGGIYPSRRGSSWNLPLFRRDCVTQARVIHSLARMHQLGQVEQSLSTALGAMRFAESHFLTPEGLFSLTANSSDAPDKEWLWTLEQVSSVLSDEEMSVWTAISELKSLGNLPSEADPMRRYFRLNALSYRLPVDEVATITGFESNKTKALLESGRKKLLKARENRFATPRADPTPSAAASFRMISAYAALFTATGDPQWRDKAVALGKISRTTFCASRFINELPNGTPDSMSDGRAFTYTIAAQAAIDLGAITIDDEWYLWALDLSTLLAEHFVTEDGRLVEVRSIAKVIDLDYENRIMIFDASTTGIVRLNLARLSALGFKTPPALKPWLTSMPPIEKAPIIFTDTLNAMSYHWSHSRVDVGPEASEDLFNAVCMLPLELFERRVQRDAADSVKVTPFESETSLITDPAAIPALIKTP